MTLPWQTRAADLSPDAVAIFEAHTRRSNAACDRQFGVLFAVQWVAGMVVARVYSPRAWAGSASTANVTVATATWVGLAIVSLPVAMIVVRPGRAATRHLIAAAQMMTSALLIHLSGGRIETHFHIFGSLALLAFYRDWRVLATATAVIAADHAVRGKLVPASVFGVADGRWRWVEHAAWVLFEDAILLMGVTRGRGEVAEIAARQAEMASAVQMARADRDDLLRALNAGTIVGMSDGDGRITYVNDYYLAVSKFTREELIGRRPEAFRADGQTEAAWADMRRVVSAGGLWTGELCRQTKDGRAYWVQVSSLGLLGPDGRHRRTVTIQHDITRRKVAEAHSAQAQRLESIGQLASGIAHEINTPTQYVGDNVRFLKDQFAGLMAVVAKYAALLDPGAGSVPWDVRRREVAEALASADYEFARVEVPAALDQSLEGLGRVASIVLAMKDFSHPGSATKEPADLNRSIASTLEVCRNRWKYVADLRLDLDEGLPRVPCLVAEFNQVVLNLVVNAADAIGERRPAGRTDKGTITVATRVGAGGGHVEVTVADDGPGMPDHVQRRLFEPFFTTKPVGKGTGQGLALSRDVIVNKHGGRLTFASAPGRGTTFTVVLPLAAAARAGDEPSTRPPVPQTKEAA